MFIEKFKIEGLFGFRTVEITFGHPILILIGENGYGKTTILNALNYTLQGCYKELCSIKFTNIEIEIAGKQFSFSKDLLQEYLEFIQTDNVPHSFIRMIQSRLSPGDFNLLCTLVSENRKDFSAKIDSPFLSRYPQNAVFEEIKRYLNAERKMSVFRSLKSHIDSFNYTVLFKPTYRRVEADLNASFTIEKHRLGRSSFDDDDEPAPDYAATIIRFGMQDVKRMINEVTESIKRASLLGFAKVSSDMIRHLLETGTDSKLSTNMDIKSLKIILDRTGDNLSQNEKDKILKLVSDGKQSPNSYLIYFLNQLYDVYREQERLDTSIKRFRDVCNGYFREKQFVYDESRVDLTIYRTDESGAAILNEDAIVDLNNLSSGEKQIVSIFAQIYLDYDKKFVMLLDEPELSLSIYWQEKLLSDITASNRCEFLLAVTHSPFIFRNQMKEYVVGLQEFLKYKE